jgi:secondary thiamine-phosphate synthase enzyme
VIEKLKVNTPSHSCFVEITSLIQQVVSRCGSAEGICHIFVPHTTAAITINENADPTVRSDMIEALNNIVPWQDDYAHAEGNSAAHIKASMFGHSHFVLVSGGKLQLGTWQGIYLAEFDGPRTRQIWVKVTKDS